MTPASSKQSLLDNDQFLQCVLLSQTEEELLNGKAIQRGYRFVDVDIAGIETSDDLMKRMAGALDFPTYFGGNWDAFLDMVTDLSWTPAAGYVVLLRNAEALLRLSSEQLAVFVRVCTAAVKCWQSGEDEAGNAIPRTPFYFLLEGQPPFCRLLSDLLMSGECES